MDFTTLCDRFPALESLRNQARQAGRASGTNWYAEWAERCHLVRDVSLRVAQAVDIDARQIVGLVRNGLIDAYAVERQRERRRERRPA
jgi:hypothetical protein